MKRFTALSIAGLLLFCTAACSKEEEIEQSIFENNEAELSEVLMSNSSFGGRFVSFHEIKINQPDE